MVNNSLYLSIGEDATVRLNVQITIDCKQLINDAKKKGEKNPNITWTKDGLIITNESIPNVFISEDKKLVIDTRITFATNDGNYTCEVCDVGLFKHHDCERETSYLKVCGEIRRFILKDIYNIVFLGEPHIKPPQSDPVLDASHIILTCGNDVTSLTLIGYTISFLCEIHNGSEPFSTSIYKDGVPLDNLIFQSFDISRATNSDFGTYTFMVATEHCGTAIAVSRLLQEGQFL